MKKTLEFRLNMPRMLEVVCWFAKRGDSGKIGIHALMKMLFFADVKHLNEHYVPILGGNYVALKYGPVHSELYDTLKDNYAPISEVGAELPFTLEKHEITPHREADEGEFSKAGLECLERSWQEHGGKNFMELTSLSHTYPAWEKAWLKSSANSVPMDYEDFFDHEVDKEILEDLKIYGRAMAI